MRRAGSPRDADPSQIAGRTGDSLDEIDVTVTVDFDRSEATMVEAEQGAFLLPVWNPGFWAMPPGGMTRFLIPSRTFVNPDQTLISATNDIDAIRRATD